MIQVDHDFEQEFPDASATATERYANIIPTGDRLIGLHDRQVWGDYRISGAAKQALAVLDGAGEPLEPDVIAERLIITSGSMTSLLDTLEKSGLVRRARHPQDRQKLLIDITEAGTAVVDAILPAFHARERAIIEEALSPREQEQLLTFVAKVQRSIVAHTDDPVDRDAKPVRPARLPRSGSSGG
ncbi:MAG TPA: MarR family transcriptional regulator [Acidimicrobiales bacterium]|nr:MarR family transcriptional regulator [Acidimicrobiales bacterium]